MVTLMSPIVNISDAPPLCRAVLTELCEVTATLHQVEHFIAGRLSDGGPVPRDRYELVLIEQLAAVLTGCVMIKDDLEPLVDDLGLVYSETGISGTFDRARWVRKEQDIGRVLARLQNHKSSLSSDIKHSVDRLHALFEQAMVSSPTLLTRLERFRESGGLDAEVETGPGDAGESICAADPRTPGEPFPNSKDASDASSARSVGSRIASISRGWESALQSSWVYRRQFLATSDGHSETSITTSTRRRATASIFSATSLADISHLSQFSLPILIWEIGNNRWYIEVARRDTGGWVDDLASGSMVLELIMQVETMMGKIFDIAVTPSLSRQLAERQREHGDVTKGSFVRVYTHSSESFDIHAGLNVSEFKPVNQCDITDRLYSRLHLLLKHRTAEVPTTDAKGGPRSLGAVTKRRAAKRTVLRTILSAGRRYTSGSSPEIGLASDITLDPRYTFDLKQATSDFASDSWASEGLVSTLCSVRNLRPPGPSFRLRPKHPRAMIAAS